MMKMNRAALRVCAMNILHRYALTHGIRSGFRKLRHTSNGVLEEDGFDEGEEHAASVLYPGLFDNNPPDTDISDLEVR